MYIRLKKNASGTTSVLLISSERLPGKKNPYSRILKSFGSAKTTERLAQLKLLAENYLSSMHSLKTPKASLDSLVIETAADVSSCTTKVRGFNDIYNKLYSAIFADSSLKTKGNDMLSQLAIMRIIEPKSKNYTANIASNFGYDLKVDSIYKLMDRIDDNAITKIKACGYRNTKRLLAEDQHKLDVLFYDLTSIYFETNNKDELRNFGFSKDGKSQHVQIMLAMIVTHHGLPVAYETFEGNTYEGSTLIPTLTNLRKKYKINRVILVADSGLINKDNVEQIAASGLEYVIGARLKNSSRVIINKALSDEDYVNISDGTKGKSHIFIDKETEEPTGHKLMFYYSEARAKKDAYERDKALSKINKQIGQKAKTKLSGALRKSYVTLSQADSTIGIDEAKLKEATKFDGYFTIQTNIKGCNPAEVLQYYSGLWQIEQTFRITKYNLKIRPVFHYNPARIKAHFAICYIALVLLRTLELMMKRAQCYIPIEQLHELLWQVKEINIASRNKSFSLSTDFPESLEPIYKIVKTRPPARFTSSQM
jgi:transposase